MSGDLRLAVHRDTTWTEQAACYGEDPNLFFPPNRSGPGAAAYYARQTAPAKRICARCPVRAECLDYSIRAREPYGVWGGLDEHERKTIRRRRRSRP